MRFGWILMAFKISVALSCNGSYVLRLNRNVFLQRRKTARDWLADSSPQRTSGPSICRRHPTSSSPSL